MTEARFSSVLGVASLFASIVALGFGQVLAAAAAVTFALSFGVFFLKAKRNEDRVRRAKLTIGGTAIEGLNVANINRVSIKSLRVFESRHRFVIDDTSVEMTFEYKGVCVDEQELGMLFSVSCDALRDLSDLNCAAFDLCADEKRKHRISPVVVGAEGLSRRLRVPFLKAPKRGDLFHIEFSCCYVNSVRRSGWDYVFSTMSFDQIEPIDHVATLQFKGGGCPTRLESWCVPPKGTECVLLAALPLLDSSNGVFEGRDHDPIATGTRVRIYVFERLEAQSSDVPMPLS